MGIYPNESDQDIEDRYEREEFRRLPLREQYHGFPAPLETQEERRKREDALTQFAALSEMSRIVAKGGAS
jgi:hypothetical protein